MRNIRFQWTAQGRKSAILGFVGKSRLGRIVARVSAKLQMQKNGEGTSMLVSETSYLQGIKSIQQKELELTRVHLEDCAVDVRPQFRQL